MDSILIIFRGLRGLDMLQEVLLISATSPNMRRLATNRRALMKFSPTSRATNLGELHKTTVKKWVNDFSPF